MKQLKDVISKIRFDKRENPDDFTFYYVDRISKRKIGIKFKAIKSFQDSVFTIERNGEDVEIPFHRIREVTKKGIKFWVR